MMDCYDLPNDAFQATGQHECRVVLDGSAVNNIDMLTTRQTCYLISKVKAIDEKDEKTEFDVTVVPGMMIEVTGIPGGHVAIIQWWVDDQCGDEA